MIPNFSLLFLLNEHNELLMLRRVNTPFSNHCYSLPGCSIGIGHSATEAIIGEAKETLNIMIKPNHLDFIHVMHRKCNEPEFFTAVFKPQLFAGTIENLAWDKYDDLRWFALNKLPENTVAAHKHAVEHIQRGIFYSEHGWNI